MKKILFVLFNILLLGISGTAMAQHEIPVNTDLLQNKWKANWITCPDVAPRAYGIYHFRKKLSLQEAPEKFIVHVTADNRYRLFVNGKAVSLGPARGDLYNWYFESVDLAPYLTIGENIIAAQVWNMGEHAPVAQISNRTGFLLQGDTEKESLVNTDASWKVIQNKAYQPCSMDNGARLRAYMVIGPGDEVDAASYPWNWEQLHYNDHDWRAAAVVTAPSVFGHGTDNLWTLTPRNIPPMEETLQWMGHIRKTEGMSVDDTFLKGEAPLSIPADSKVSILIDQGFNTVAYPELVSSGGKGACIQLSYAEALLDTAYQKGNRDDIDGKRLIGNYDIYRADGGQQRLFRPLWLRTFRYVQLDIETKEEALTIERLYGMYTGYPFQERAIFRSNDASLQDIWKVGWRTARLCAGETYYDCPYYEQLQYEADTRIQALISLYVSGDDRLARKALLDFYFSRVPEGLTQGRYPSNRLQVIPTFSLWWVSMIHDYWMLRKDDAFIAQFLIGIRGVLDWYEKRIDTQINLLGPMKWWNFVDYTDVFPNGVPEGADDGSSSVITLQYVYTLRQAAQLFAYFGDKSQSNHYEEVAARLAKATYAACFDEGKGVMANTPSKEKFSQHASIMGVLSEAIPSSAHQEVMQKVLRDTTLGPATFYYRFYLTQALKKAGLGDLYYQQLSPWRDMLKAGLTTFAEKPDPARSDCHAWSASPNYDFLATICGIMPGSAGFEKVLIQPALGDLQEVDATMPHPAGDIRVSLQRKGDKGVKAVITLPEKVEGEFVWYGKKIALQSGKKEIVL